MALNFAHGAIQWLAADVATTTYVVSGLGFQPKAIRFYCVGIQSATDATSTTVNERRSIGFAVSTSSRRCVATLDVDAADPMTCATGQFTDCVIATISSAPARDGALDVSAFGADGFTAIVDDAAPVNITVFWEAWGGSDISVATVGDITEPAATGNVDYTVTGFVTGANDQIVMFAGVQATAADTAARNDSGLYVGAASSGLTANNIVACVNSDDASADSDTDRYGLGGECLAMIVVGGGNPDARATLTQFGTNNFRLNWLARAVTGRLSIFMAIKGGRWEAGTALLDSTTVGNTVTIATPGFVPLGVCGMGVLAPQHTAGTATAASALTLGSASSASSRRGMSTFSVDASAAADIRQSIQYDEFLPFTSTGADSFDTDIDLLDATGFRLIWDGTTTEAEVKWIGYVTFANAQTKFNLVRP